MMVGTLKMNKKLILLTILIEFFIFVSPVFACAPSPGTNIYLTGVTVDFEKLGNLGTEGENYTLEGPAFIYRSSLYPDKIAVEVSRDLIIIAPFSQNYIEAKQIANSVDWNNLVTAELNFLVNKNILTGMTVDDIANIADCSAGTSMIKKDITETTVISKECNDWYQVSSCIYDISNGEKQTICPTCGPMVLSGSIPAGTVNLEIIIGNDSVPEKGLVENDKKETIQPDKTEEGTNNEPFNNNGFYLFILIIAIIFVAVALKYKNKTPKRVDKNE